MDFIWNSIALVWHLWRTLIVTLVLTSLVVLFMYYNGVGHTLTHRDEYKPTQQIEKISDKVYFTLAGEKYVDRPIQR